MIFIGPWILLIFFWLFSLFQIPFELFQRKEKSFFSFSMNIWFLFFGFFFCQIFIKGRKTVWNVNKTKQWKHKWKKKQKKINESEMKKRGKKKKNSDGWFSWFWKKSLAEFCFSFFVRLLTNQPTLNQSSRNRST